MAQLFHDKSQSFEVDQGDQQIAANYSRDQAKEDHVADQKQDAVELWGLQVFYVEQQIQGDLVNLSLLGRTALKIARRTARVCLNFLFCFELYNNIKNASKETPPM